MKRFLLSLSITSVLFGCSSVENDSAKKFSLDDCPDVAEAPLIQCVKQYKLLGISPDAALKECQSNKLSGCIKELAGTNYIAKAIKEGEEGYLIDLGNEQTRWMQGDEWRDFECVPSKEGSLRVQDDRQWKFEKKRIFYRQGWCKSDSIRLNQPISTEEAKIQCDLQALTPIKQTMNIRNQWG